MSQPRINIKLRNIDIQEFAIFDENIPSSGNLGYQANFSYTLYEELKQIECTIVVELVQEKDVFLKLKTGITYLIKEDDFESFKKEKTIIIPKNILRSITDLSMGTVRGILFSKLEKTNYHKFLLPLIDITNVVNEDEVFQLK